MPNMHQVRAPTTSVSGGAPVRHWLLVGNCNAFTDDFSSPSRTQTIEPGPPSNSVDKSKKEQCGQSPDKAVTESTAPFTCRCTFSGGRYKDANEGAGNVSGVGTVPLTSTPGRPSQNPDEDAASAQCASEVVAAPHKMEACTPTPKETRRPHPSAELSGAPLTLSREQAEDGVDAVQMRDPSHVPARERAALLSPLLSLLAPPGEHVGGVDRSTGAMRPAPVRVTASENAFGQQADARTSANTSDSSTDCVFACAPETPHRPTQARFFRSLMPRWQGARTPDQAPLKGNNDEGSVDTQGDSKKVTQWRTPGWVLREETGSCAIPPPIQPAVSTSSPVREKGEEGSGVSGEDCADPDECDCLDTPTTTGVVRKQCQGNASLEHSSLSAVSILPRPNATHYAAEDLSSAAAIEPFKSNCGSPISSSIPPHPNSSEESTSDTTPLRHSHTANPALWRTGSSGHGHEGGLCAAELHTPDAARALPPLLQSASPSLQENGDPISRSLSPAVRSDACKRVPPSSGRGPSSSYGCSDGSSTLEGHRTRRRTSYGDTDEDDDSRGISASQNITRPLEESAQEAEQLHRRLPTDSVVAVAELPGVCLSSTDYVVTSDAALQHYYGDLAVLSSPSQRENAACLPEADWRSALQFSYTLLAEYQRSVLTALMTACTAAWLPPKALCTLGHVSANAYTLPRVVEHVPAVGIAVPEVHLLFQLYCTTPSESAADGLIELFFATQLARYVNWVHHLLFYYMYARMVALRAVSMMELHERRLICMQRDLGIRDAIELFMLLAPHPRAPKVSTGRRVFSTFRMALYALSGGGGGGDAGVTTALAKSSGSSSTRTQHKLSPPSTPRCVPGCQLIADVELGQRRPPPVEPLFASETWNADRAACDVSAVTARTNHKAGGSLGDALNAERKVAGATNSPRERPEHHSGTQHLLCTTDPNECGPVAARSSGGGISSLFPALRLPKLIRSTPRTTSVAHMTSKATGTVAAQTSRSRTMRRDKDDLSQNCRSLASSRSQNGYQLSKQNCKDVALLNGGLRAREKQPPRKLSRASASPTDADFVNLRDAQVLKRFVK
ncbi:hypothetical protein, conserved [Leishmania tarentolae]|uniref:Uncharacterized protein n=1 Tax=Leishmania tarentolae TaxID=5689 RepID=A0A640KI83_LEITA|nr:hypothetical protein, conserved [Leishmania tarentolae]